MTLAIKNENGKILDAYLYLRWDKGPKSNGVHPIFVVFSDQEDKDQLWSKLSMKIVDDIVKRRSSIAITNVSTLLLRKTL